MRQTKCLPEKIVPGGVHLRLQDASESNEKGAVSVTLRVALDLVPSVHRYALAKEVVHHLIIRKLLLTAEVVVELSKLFRIE